MRREESDRIAMGFYNQEDDQYFSEDGINVNELLAIISHLKDNLEYGARDMLKEPIGVWNPETDSFKMVVGVKHGEANLLEFEVAPYPS